MLYTGRVHTHLHVDFKNYIEPHLTRLSYYTPLSSLNLSILTFLMTYAAGLLAAGYFLDYSHASFQLYTVGILLWGALWTLWSAIKLNTFETLYVWFVFYLFFPKKELIGENTPVLFNTGLHLLDGTFSLHSVLEIFIAASLFISFIRNKTSLSQNTKLHFRPLSIALACIAIVGMIHILFMSYGYEKNTFASILEWNNIVISLAVLLCAKSITSLKKVEQLLFAFIILGIVLSLEYGLGRLDILPNSVAYFSFNYRNAFRSIFMSNDLMLGMFAICAAGAALFFYLRKSQSRYLVLFFCFHFLTLETFNRSNSFALYISIITICIIAKSWKNIGIYLFILVTILHPLSMLLSTIPAANKFSEEQLQGKYSWVGNHSGYTHAVHSAYDRPGGYFSTTSTLQRFGAFFRATDTFIEHPIMGSGPANTTKAMISPSIATHVNLNWLPEDALFFYNRIKTGEQPTNAHSYYFHILSEYGVSAIFLIISLGVVAIQGLLLAAKHINKRNRPSLAMYMVALSFALFFCFQAKPLLLPLLIVFLHLYFSSFIYLNQEKNHLFFQR